MAKAEATPDQDDIDESREPADEPDASDEAAEEAAAGAPSRTENGSEDSKKPPPEEPPPNVAPLRKGSLVIFLVGAALTLLLMAIDRRLGTWGVPVGALGVGLASLGLLDFLGLFDLRPSEEKNERSADVEAEPAHLGPRLVEAAAALVVFVAILKLAVSGTLATGLAFLSSSIQPHHQIVVAAVLIPVVFLWLVVAVFRVGRSLGPWRLDENGEDRPLLRRHGFWLVTLVTVLYLPMLGSFSLSDPWETHYGEVAREMLARNDWISLWWAQDGWFWSKPIFDFWIQGLSFATLGVRYMPDQMLMAVSSDRWPQPEWAARMPVFLITLLGGYLLYAGVARAAGRRAGFLAGVVLTTMPYWFFLSHQTMTDMPYVGPLTGAFGCFLLGFNTDAEREAKRFPLRIGKRTLQLSVAHLVLGALVLLVLPQVLYLLSQNLTLRLAQAPYGFAWHWDTFFSGSGGGNCGLPGNEACRFSLTPRYAQAYLQPAALGLLWLVALVIILLLNRGERRLQRYYFLAAWILVALAALAKGAPGLVLPVATVLAYVGATRSFKELSRLELPVFLLIFAVIVLPWYTQMYLRHGGGFIDRLVIHDMYKRAFVHVHDTNAGDDTSFRYYVWQLGYGLFPWTGLAVAGLTWFGRPRENSRVARLLALMLLWFLCGFGMFSITQTKFHHYIFPIVPAIAVGTGVVLDRILGPAPFVKRGALAPYLAFLGAGTLLMTYGISWMFQGQLSGGFEPSGELRPGSPWVGGVLLFIGVLVSGWAVLGFGRPRTSSELDIGDDDASRSYTGALFGVTGLAAAIVIAIVGRDMFVSNKGDVEGQARLIQLFTYNYRRPWPESLDFNGTLATFTVAAGVASAAFIARRFRAHAATAFTLIAVWWAAWGVNGYLVQAAPHWGQRETILAYYRHRQSPNEQIVAYQMNWKGENFYTGNRIPAYVSSGKKFKDWIQSQRESGVKVMYFSTEHSRVGNLKRELDNPDDFQVLTDKKLNNKFMLARVKFGQLEAKGRASKKKEKKKKEEGRTSPPPRRRIVARQPGASPSASAASSPAAPVPSAR